MANAKALEIATALDSALDTLDLRLTGGQRGSGKVASNIRTLSGGADFEAYYGEIYLSDAGYSRVWYRDYPKDSAGLTLTSNSRDEVRAEWDAAAPEREAVENLFRQLDELRWE